MTPNAAELRRVRHFKASRDKPRPHPARIDGSRTRCESSFAVFGLHLSRSGRGRAGADAPAGLGAGRRTANRRFARNVSAGRPQNPGIRERSVQPRQPGAGAGPAAPRGAAEGCPLPETPAPRLPSPWLRPRPPRRGARRSGRERASAPRFGTEGWWTRPGGAGSGPPPRDRRETRGPASEPATSASSSGDRPGRPPPAPGGEGRPRTRPE